VARPIVEEPPQSSPDDEEPIQKVEAPPTIVKKSPKLDFDSDDDDLFGTKKKQTPATPIVEQKDKTPVANERNNVNDLAVKEKRKNNFLINVFSLVLLFQRCLCLVLNKIMIQIILQQHYQPKHEPKNRQLMKL
jgi:hypothetical protein